LVLGWLVLGWLVLGWLVMSLGLWLVGSFWAISFAGWIGLWLPEFERRPGMT